MSSRNIIEGAETRPTAWEPLTPRGVAAFARASWGRLLLVQFLMACLAAAVVAWALQTDWFPVVRAAAKRLPEQAGIRSQTLIWPDDNPVLLAKNRFLGLAVDLDHSNRLGHEAHLQVEFGRRDFRIISRLGYYTVVQYAPDWQMDFSRAAFEPWWGAWESTFLAGAAGAVVLGLMLSWVVLATLYCLPVRLITFLENRDLNLRQSWRLAGAAMMPGALFLTFGIFCYGMQWIDLMMLASLFVLHFLAGWVYLVLSPLFLPKPTGAPTNNGNPFKS